MRALTATGRLNKFAERAFPDDFMLVLAALLVPVTLLPFVWTLSPFTETLFHRVNDLIVLVFVLEYLLKFLGAESRWSFAKDPWRILDLVIIGLASLDYLPINVSGGRFSPLLRLLRVARFVAIAGRAARRAGLIQDASARQDAPHAMEMRLLEGDSHFRSADPDEIRRHVSSPTNTWVDLQCVGDRDLGFISELTGLPGPLLRNKVIEELFPRIETLQRQTTIFLWDSRLAGSATGEVVRVEKTSILVVFSGPNVLTLSTGCSDLFERIVHEGLPMPGEPFTARVLYAVLRAVMSDCETIVRGLEQKTARFEDAPIGAAGHAFLAETFHLKKEIQKARYNLWHIRQVLDSIRTRRPAAAAGSETLAAEFEHLQAEAQYLYETLENVRDGLMSLIELHLNTVSFEMNRVMRILAVITCVSVVPAVIGGLLGQNLTDQPYGITLKEVASLAAIVMLLVTYAFWRKGWLRG